LLLQVYYSMRFSTEKCPWGTLGPQSPNPTFSSEKTLGVYMGRDMYDIRAPNEGPFFWSVNIPRLLKTTRSCASSPKTSRCSANPTPRRLGRYRVRSVPRHRRLCQGRSPCVWRAWECELGAGRRSRSGGLILRCYDG